LFQPWKC